MAKVPGINFSAPIVPIDENDRYPTHYSKYGKGGWREVQTIEERDLIPIERRSDGMAVFVRKAEILSDGTYKSKFYTYNESLGLWEEFLQGKIYTAGKNITIENDEISAIDTVPSLKGMWDTWTDVPTDSTLYPKGLDDDTTPKKADYLIIKDPSDYPVAEGETPLSGTYRFVYTGVWETATKTGWKPEYSIAGDTSVFFVEWKETN